VLPRARGDWLEDYQTPLLGKKGDTNGASWRIYTDFILNIFLRNMPFRENPFKSNELTRFRKRHSTLTPMALAFG
jgi:hypothetical protein